jgi:AcrR family transcriptional regulator
VSKQAAETAPLEGGTHDRLIEAAIEVFSERGYEGARVQEIAQRAGLTTGAIYGRFKGKAGLLAEALMTRSRSDVQNVTQAINRGVTGAAAFREFGQRLIAQGIMPKNSLVLDAVAAARRDAELASVLREYIGELGARIAEVTKHAQEAGEMDPSLSVDAFTYYCLSLLFGVVTLKALDVPTPNKGEWDRILKRILVALAYQP